MGKCNNKTKQKQNWRNEKSMGKLRNLLGCTAWKVSKYGVFSGLYFPVCELNTEIYSVNLRIQSENRKIRTRKNSVFGHSVRIVDYDHVKRRIQLADNTMEAMNKT